MSGNGESIFKQIEMFIGFEILNILNRLLYSNSDHDDINVTVVLTALLKWKEKKLTSIISESIIKNAIHVHSQERGGRFNGGLNAIVKYENSNALFNRNLCSI